jgi:hypothetical protein
MYICGKEKYFTGYSPNGFIDFGIRSRTIMRNVFYIACLKNLSISLLINMYYVRTYIEYEPY